jgi:hypothetical protein
MAITDKQIVAVIHDKDKSKSDRINEAANMIRRQMAEAEAEVENRKRGVMNKKQPWG